MTTPASNPLPWARPNARPVMKEVADRAGVALSSVSRVMNGHPDVSEVMRNRVLDAVAALGYERDLLAQSLRTGATMSVGFLVGDISNPLMSQIALGAEVELMKADYSTLLTNSMNDPVSDVLHLRLLQQRRVDGLLLSLSDESDPQMLAALQGLNTPGVLVDRQVDGSSFSSVLSDHAAGITSAARLLADLGHTRIGLVNGNPRVRPSRERATALRRFCRQNPGMSAVIKASAFTAQHGYRATREMLSATDPPAALIAGSNQILVGVLRAIRELKVNVPEDVSLVTCDDVPLAELFQPPITTITRDNEAIGRLAAQLLLERLRGEPARHVVLPTGLRATESCAPPGTHNTERNTHG
jgi:LacI family transcriptional regulator